MIKKLIIIAVLILSSNALIARAEIVLSTSPEFSEEKAKQYFQPLVAKLSQLLGEKVIYYHNKNWGDYKTKMQAGDFHIIIDQPHLAAWRMAKDNRMYYDLVGQFPGGKRYTVVLVQDSSIQSLLDLNNRKVCIKPSPDISALLFLKQFNNPIYQPVLIELRDFSDHLEGYNKLLQQECDAWIVDFDTYNQIEDDNKLKFKVRFTTEYIPNMVISISKKMHDAHFKLVKTAFIENKLTAQLSELFNYYAPREKHQIVPIQRQDLKAVEDILSTDVWGW